MKAMTAEQRQIINNLLEKVGDLLSEERMIHILNAINPAASSNYPHGQIIIRDLSILLENKNLNKEKTMKAMTEGQKALIAKLMTDYHQLFTPREHTALREVFEAHDNKTKIASFEAAEGTIKYLNEKISTHKEIQSEKRTVVIDDGFETTNTISKEEIMKYVDDDLVQYEQELAERWDKKYPPCEKCSGTGVYNVPLKDGSIGKCFTCKGTGTKKVNTKLMSKAQENLIRNLYKEVMQFMTEDQKSNLIKKMTAHINGSQKQTSKWASAAIDKLFEIKAAKKS